MSHPDVPMETTTLTRPAKPKRRTGETADPGRRLFPRIVDSDWLLMRGMRRVISAIVADAVLPGMTALDFGCGSKPYAPLFIAAGAEYVGADFDGAPEVRIGSDGRIQTEARHDLVVSFQVLEHVRDLELYFAEARRVLRDDGRMILSTHGTWLYHPHPEDHRRWTRQGLVSEIEHNGFEVLRCEPVVGPMGWTHMIRITGICFLLKRFGPLGRAGAAVVATIINVRAWIEDRFTPEWITADNACVYVTLCRPKRSPA